MRQGFQDRTGTHQGKQQGSSSVEACAKLINKVIPKDNALEDNSMSAKLFPWGDDPKQALINMGGNMIKINGEGCVLAQSLKPEGESLKQSINTNIGGE